MFKNSYTYLEWTQSRGNLIFNVHVCANSCDIERR